MNGYSSLLLTLLAVTGIKQATAVGCELVTSVKNGASAENEVGFIFVPGATVPGQQYAPLVAAVLADYPGNAWGAVTRDWDNDFPNPLGMNEAVQACYDLVGWPFAHWSRALSCPVFQSRTGTLRI